MKSYYVYILSNRKRGTLYVGSTDNLTSRLYQHKYGLIEGFTKRYAVDQLVYYEETVDPSSAVTRERNLKNWHRDWKINLIESVNPDWRDLSQDW